MSDQHQDAMEATEDFSSHQISSDLLGDGQVWRSQLPFSEENADRLLRNFRQQHPTLTQHNSLQLSQTPAIQRKRITMQHTRFGKKAIISATSVLVLGIILAVLFLRPQPPPSHIGTLALPSNWIASNTKGATTPQEAFAKGFQIWACDNHPPLASIATWLMTNAQFGLVLVDVTCPQRSYLMLIAVHQNKDKLWDDAPQFVTGIIPSSVAETKYAAHVPAWLPLPPANYGLISTTGGAGIQVGFPSIVVRGWINDSQLYLGGWVTTTGSLPASTQPIQIANHSGQATITSAMTTILVPISAQKTFIFISTGSFSDAAKDATALFLHLDLLPSINS